jgi:23S rRNA pseudouridine2605 synthase
MSQQPFQKFINKKKNSAVKESFKQERKKAKKERAEYFDRLREEKRQVARAQGHGPAVSNKRGAPADKKPMGTAPTGKAIARQAAVTDKKSTDKTIRSKTAAGSTAKPTTDKASTGKATSPAKKSMDRATKHQAPTERTGPSTTYKTAKGQPTPVDKKTMDKTAQHKAAPHEPTMPLNKYLAHCGVASRRETVELIKAGKVKVNGQVVTEPAHKVGDTDEVKFNGKKLFVTKNLVYILLNKPKDYITTTDDPQGRKTVLDLIRQATTERVYPIGRLDRNTSGVLLLTNDGELTQRLSHPSYQVKKIYEAKLDKPLTKTDFDKIMKGLKLEDGPVTVDALGYADSRDKSVIGLEIHSGRNRIVRRIFEHLGYDVKGLDRVMYASLTKKNVERGRWRYLSEKEIRQLKFMNKSKGIKQ